MNISLLHQSLSLYKAFGDATIFLIQYYNVDTKPLFSFLSFSYQKAYLLTKSAEEFSGEKMGEWANRQKKKTRQKEQHE